MATRGARWAFWLEAALDERGWSRAEITKRSRKKPNGRPIIDGSRVSEWLNKNEAPRDPEILHEIAHVLGVRVSAVLNAAGWLPDEELDSSLEMAPAVGLASVAEAIRHDADLLQEAREHLLNQYELLLRISPAQSVARGKQSPRRAMTSPAAEPLRAVARGGDPKDREAVGRLARRAREEHERQARGKKE